MKGKLDMGWCSQEDERGEGGTLMKDMTGGEYGGGGGKK